MKFLPEIEKEIVEIERRPERVGRFQSEEAQLQVADRRTTKRVGVDTRVEENVAHERKEKVLRVDSSIIELRRRAPRELSCNTIGRLH